MKQKVAFAAAMLLTPLVAFAAKNNQADYNLPVHVCSSRLVYECGPSSGSLFCRATLRIMATVGGEKLELHADTSELLRKGDYKAKLKTVDDSDVSVPAYVDQRDYEFLLPDGKKETFKVVGEPEE